MHDITPFQKSILRFIGTDAGGIAFVSPKEIFSDIFHKDSQQVIPETENNIQIGKIFVNDLYLKTQFCRFDPSGRGGALILMPGSGNRTYLIGIAFFRKQSEYIVPKSKGKLFVALRVSVFQYTAIAREIYLNTGNSHGLWFYIITNSVYFIRGIADIVSLCDSKF